MSASGAREQALGPEHPDTLTNVNNLAFFLYDRGRLRRMPSRSTKRPLDAREQVLGPEHPDTLVSVNNLAELL